MKSKAFLIPPSSHFLKSLANFLRSKLDLKSPEATKHLVIFPTKRAALFFKYYLTQKVTEASFFLPKILAWEEFLKELYIQTTSSPGHLIPERGKILIFLQTLNSIGIHWNEPEKMLYWGDKFIEVFEEFEREGKIPQDLLYPPETLPEQAKSLFERLSQSYRAYKNIIKEQGIFFQSEILSSLRETLSRTNFSTQLIKGLYLAGFVALREGERELIKRLRSLLAESRLPLLFFFEDSPLSIHPLIKKTLEDLDLPHEPLPSPYLEKEVREPRVILHSFPEQESEMRNLRDYLEKREVNLPDEVAIVLPHPTSLLPLIHEITTLPLKVNITLPFSAKLLPPNKWLILLLRAQRERKNNLYPTYLFWRILNFPLAKALYSGDKSFFKLLEEVKAHLREAKTLEISPEDLLDSLTPSVREIFTELYQRLFTSWEDLHSPREVVSALRGFMDFIKPLAQGEALNSLLTRHFLLALEEDLLPLFEIPSLWRNLPQVENQFFYRFLETLLSTLDLPLYGDPLTGLQILGFLESRLLSFKRLFLLDTNEGALPPFTPFNPLLTDEIKNYLGLPIYKNELWDYYFERLLSSSEEVFLFYIKTEKGKGDLLGEPSRYIQKLMWKREREGKLLEEASYRLQIFTPSEREAIPKGEKEQDLLLKLIREGGLSRHALELYLTCPVKFYFNYLFSLKEQESHSLEEREIGLFLHSYFENLFKNYLNRPFSARELLSKGDWVSLFEAFWKSHNFEKKLDPLSAFLSYRIALTSIERYLHYLLRLEKEFSVETEILGVEKTLSTKLPLPFSFKGLEEIKYWGRTDFIIKRVLKGGRPIYFILDFKSNPNVKPTPTNLNKLRQSTPPNEFSKEALFSIKKLFGSNLSNFQLLFYLYLFLTDFDREEENHILNLNAGYITPTNFENPESYLLKFPLTYQDFEEPEAKRSTKGRKKTSQEDGLKDLLKENFEPHLLWLTRHLLEVPEFYFTDDEEECRYCPFKSPCKITKIAGEDLWRKNSNLSWLK